MKDIKGKIQDLTAQLELVTYQRDMLARYAMESPELNEDLCILEEKAERCPFRLPPYDTDPRICTECILRNLQLILDHAGIVSDAPAPQEPPEQTKRMCFLTFLKDSQEQVILHFSDGYLYRGKVVYTGRYEVVFLTDDGRIMTVDRRTITNLEDWKQFL